MVNALFGSLLLSAAATSVSARVVPKANLPFTSNFYDIASIPQPNKVVVEAAPASSSSSSTLPSPTSSDREYCAQYGIPNNGLVCLSPGILGVCDERNGNLFQTGVCASGTCCGRASKNGPIGCSAEACEVVSRPVEDGHENHDDGDDHGDKEEDDRQKRQLVVPDISSMVPNISDILSEAPVIIDIPFFEDLEHDDGGDDDNEEDDRQKRQLVVPDTSSMVPNITDILSEAPVIIDIPFLRGSGA